MLLILCQNLINLIKTVLSQFHSPLLGRKLVFRGPPTCSAEVLTAGTAAATGGGASRLLPLEVVLGCLVRHTASLALDRAIVKRLVLLGVLGHA